MNLKKLIGEWMGGFEMVDCIFCKIVKGEIPSKIVYKNDKVTAFRDINPKAPVHVLIVPNEHVNPKEDLEYKDVAIMPDILLAAQEVAKLGNVAKTGFRLITNVGDDAGQEVDHLHVHLLGGKKLGPMLAE
jgi:histidine triad (HIT) family protein